MQCQLIETLFETMRSIHAEQCTARDYGAGELLYHAEVNLLDVIFRHPEQSAASLAGMLGITKGALTQTAKKLIDKGLVEPYNPPGNRKTKYHRLTPAGEAVRKSHAQFHAEANARMRAYLCALPVSDKQVLTDFFKELGECGQICLYDCESAGCTCGQQGGEANVGTTSRQL